MDKKQTTDAKGKSGGSPEPASLGLKNYQYPDQFGNWMGYRVISMDKEHHAAEVGLTIRKDHLSPANRVHGGVIAALFDFGCGAAVFTMLGPEDFCSTVELKVNYMRPLELGDEIRIQAKVIFKGKRLCVLHGFAYRDLPEADEQPVAMATATFNVVRKKL